MSGHGGGVAIGRTRGENRFYNPPPIRERQQQQLLQRQKLEQQLQLKQLSVSVLVVEDSHDDVTLHSSGSGLGQLDATNLDRFIELYVWESFKEWSAYGAGVPLLLNRSDSVIQYYVPYLSAIQLYVDPSKPPTRIRRHGDDSDAESSRATSSDGSSDHEERRINGVIDDACSRHNVTDVNNLARNRAVPRVKPLSGSSSDKCEIRNPPGQLVFQYLEHNLPYDREPLADKASIISQHFTLKKSSPLQVIK